MHLIYHCYTLNHVLHVLCVHFTNLIIMIIIMIILSFQLFIANCLYHFVVPYNWFLLLYQSF